MIIIRQLLGWHRTHCQRVTKQKKTQKTDWQSELLMVRTRQATDSNPGEARAPDWMPPAGLLPR